MMRAVLAWLFLAGVAHAQTPAAPAGTQLNPNRVVIGTTPGTVAGGDALAATKATAAAAAQAAAAAVPSAAITWDGQALTYAVPNGPRVCVVVGPACPNLLPNAAATVPANAIQDGQGGHLFDPVTGQFFSLD